MTLTIDWQPLRDELALWHKESLNLPVWWRDDDAIDHTENLEKLLKLSEHVGVPVHLAVVPKQATTELAEAVSPLSNIIPVVHGWSHTSHTNQVGNNNEFSDERPLKSRVQDVTLGLERIQSLFGSLTVPMFVPPWNRFGTSLVPELEKSGYQFVSTSGARQTRFLGSNMEQINVHFDPIAWRRHRNLKNPEKLITQICQNLADRRLGRADNTEPFGMLTHHLAHSDSVWEFAERFWEEITEGPVQIYRAEATRPKADAK